MSIFVSLIGYPVVKIDGQEVAFPYRKAEGLFYYLCVKGTVSRDEVISIFWADCAENAARKNLRDAVYHLKRLFGEVVVNVNGNNKLSLICESFEPIDYFQITEKTVLEKYTDEFLNFFYIKNCFEFENWVYEIRRNLMSLYRKAIERFLSGDEEKSVDDLLKCANALMQHKLCEEDPFRRIMAMLSKINGEEAALKLYTQLCQMLKLELDEEPEEETQKLYAHIQAHLKEKKEPGRGDGFFCREKESEIIQEELYFFHTGGAAQSMLLVGEAGVGKTTILRNAVKKLPAASYCVISYQCVETEENLYLKPWQDVIAAIEAMCKKDQEHLSKQILEKDTNILVFTQYEAYFENLLEKLAERDPNKRIVLIFDDVQWFDTASQKLLSNLLQWSRNRKALFICACRSNQLQKLKFLRNNSLVRKIEIDRFSFEETGRIIRAKKLALLDNQSILRDIYRNTGGNALFLFQLLHEIEYGNNMNSLSKQMNDMIRSRLADLSADERSTLESISIFPRFATMEDIVLLTGKTQSEVLPCIEKLLLCQLVCEERLLEKVGYGFCHQIIREYIYNWISVKKREEMHRTSAICYEERYKLCKDTRLCPMLIYHYERCHDIIKHYTYQLEYLQAFYSVEHEIYPTVLMTDYGTVAMPSLGGEDDLSALAEEIRALHRKTLTAAPLRMRVEFLLGRYDLFSGRLKRGLENIHASITLAKDLQDSKSLFDNYLQMAFYAIQIHNLDMFQEYLESCEELLRKSSFSDADQYTITRLRGVYYMKKGNYQDAKTVFSDLIRKTEERHKDDPAYQVGLAACYNYIGEGYQAENDTEQALLYYLHAIRCAENSRAINSQGVFYTNAGFALFELGQSNQAQVCIDKAIRCFEESNVLWGRSKAHSYAALLAISKQEWDEARKHFAEAREVAIKGKNPVSLALIKEIEPLVNSLPQA